MSGAVGDAGAITSRLASRASAGVHALRRRLASRALRRAEALVESGRHRDAIDFLHRRNTWLKAPRVEVRLRDLRHDAFYVQRHSSSLAQWPPTTRDTFPAEPAIPEIARRDVTAERVRDGVFQRGSIIVRGLLDAADVERLAECVRHTYDAHDRVSAGASPASTGAWFVPFEPAVAGADGEIRREWYRSGGAELAADSPRALDRLIRILNDNGLVDLVAEYLGERPALSVRKTSLREIPFDLDATNGWHQDGAFLGEGIRTLNLWVALTDCGTDAPSMDMVPRRLTEIVPTGTPGAMFDWSVSPLEIERVCDNQPYTHLHFQAGDAIFFDEMNLHRTSTLPGMTRNRMALEAWFFAPSRYPVEQYPILV